MSSRSASPAKSSRRKNPLVWLGWSAAFACLTIVTAASLWWPMGRDQGVYAWVGSVIVRGGASYVDAWEVKGPATHLIYALAQLLFGRGMWGIRLLDVLMLAVATWLAWRALSRLVSVSGAALGVFLFVAWYWSLGYWETAQPDSWVAFLLLAVLALIAPGGGPSRRRALVAAGALIGVCAMLKPLFSLFALLLLIDSWPKRGGDRAGALREAGASVAGFSVVVVPVVGWLLLHGALGPFLRIQFDFNWAVHRLSKPLGMLEHLGQWYEFASDPALLIALPLATVGAVWLWAGHRRFAVATLAALALSIGGIALQSKYYPYHFTPIFAPLALLAGCGLGAIIDFDAVARRLRTGVAAGLAGLLVLVSLAALAPGTWTWMRYVGGALPKTDYHAQFGLQKADYSFRECELAARLVEDATDPDDTILVWALDPLIYYLAQRMPPSRFGAHYPLTRGELNPFEAEWRRQFMQDLAARPPARIVIADHDENNLLPKSSFHYIDDFPEFRSYLVQGYTSEATAGRFYILKPRAGSPAPPPSR